MMLPSNATRFEKVILSASLLLCALMVMYYASVMEDAYITFRVIDNVWQGFGLRWNIDERVQVYTHPLWMLLHIPLYGIIPDLYYVSLLLGFVCSAAVFALLVRQFAKKDITNLVVFGLLPLGLSRSFMTFCTSGFENSLSHLLLIMFLGICMLLLNRGLNRRDALLASLFTALSILNRMDTVILYAPVWLFLLVHFKIWRQWQMYVKPAFLGMLPLIMWLIFSLFYYGDFVPNTKHAKLDTGLPQSEYLALGRSYLLNFIGMDMPLSLPMLAPIFLLPCIFCHRKMPHMAFAMAVVVGVVCHLLYILCAGGTYITGRFLTLPALASIWVLLTVSPQFPRGRWRAGVALCLCVVTLQAPDRFHLIYLCPSCFDGVSWEMPRDAMYLREVVTGRDTITPARTIQYTQPVYVMRAVGRWAYMIDRNIILIDKMGLTDPLIGRLPINRDFLYNTGNLGRDIPIGYLPARKDGDMQRMDPDLAFYYQKLRYIVQGPLWDWERIKTIWHFQLGEYDPYFARYYARIDPLKKPFGVRYVPTN